MQTAQDKLDDSRAALERKAKLYERLATGQYADEGEVYNVDFLQKGTLEEEEQSLEREASAWRQQGTPEQPLDTAAGLLSSAGEPGLSTILRGLCGKSSTCLGLCESMSSAPLIINGHVFRAGLDRIVLARARHLSPGRRLGMQPRKLASVQALRLALCGGCAGMTNRDMERERERRQWEADELQELDDLQAKHARIDERLEVRGPPVLPMLGIRQVCGSTPAQRISAQTLAVQL